MELNEKDLRKILIIALVLLLGVLVFLIIKPVLLSILGGLILAYIFFPVYKWINKRIKYKTLSAVIVAVIVLIIIIVPLWFLIPLMVRQVFEIFQLSQSLEIQNLIFKVLPSDSTQFQTQVATAINSAVSNLASSILNSLVNFLINFPVIMLHLILVAFVFIFALKDSESLRKFVSDLSPLNKTQEKAILKQFKDITQSIVYGQIIIGFIQGILTGLGLFIFGVPNALILTVLAVILGIIPVIGPSLVYVPVAFYLFITGNPLISIGFLLYNLLIVSSADNIIRAHLVSRRTQLSQVVVLIGIIGGFLIVGILGIILGPLILAYFLTLLRAYKDKTLSTLFSR